MTDQEKAALFIIATWRHPATGAVLKMDRNNWVWLARPPKFKPMLKPWWPPKLAQVARLAANKGFVRTVALDGILLAQLEVR